MLRQERDANTLTASLAWRSFSFSARILCCSALSALRFSCKKQWQRHCIIVVALSVYSITPHHQELWFVESEPPTPLPEHAEGSHVQFPDVKQEAERRDRCGKKPFGGDLSSPFCTWQYSFLPNSDSGLMDSTAHLQRIMGKWQYKDSQSSPWGQPALPLPFSWLQSGCQSRPAVQLGLCSAFSFGCPRRAGKRIKPAHSALGTCPGRSQHPAYTEKQKQKVSADIRGHLWD